jgi:hypothetical protein
MQPFLKAKNRKTFILRTIGKVKKKKMKALLIFIYLHAENGAILEIKQKS